MARAHTSSGPLVQKQVPKVGTEKAGVAARREGWVVGDWLMSAKWKEPREIVEMNDIELYLHTKYVPGGSISRSWVKTIPVDAVVVVP